MQVVVLNDAKLRLQSRVVQQGVLLFGRDESRRVDFARPTRNAYFDFQTFVRPIDRAHLGEPWAAASDGRS